MAVKVAMSENTRGEEMEKIGLDLIAHIPWEEVVNLRTTLPHPTLGGTVRQDVQLDGATPG